MTATTARRERRRFTNDEFQKMLAERIVSPHEDAILNDGIVLVPEGLANRYRASTDAGPVSGIVPQDVVLAEAPPISHARQEVASAMTSPVRLASARYVPRKFTVDEYYRLAKVGILSPDERIELLDGEITIMAAMGSRHAACIIDFDEQIQERIGRRASKAVQIPVLLEENYAPEPDIMLLQRREGYYGNNVPVGSDVLLVIEVGDTTIGDDRRDKLPAYARANVPETWLVDVRLQVVEVYTEPLDGQYRRSRLVGLEDALTPTAFPDVQISVSDVMRW